jgi:hypothetical protein
VVGASDRLRRLVPSDTGKVSSSATYRLGMPARFAWREEWIPALIFGAVAILLWLIVGLSVAYLPINRALSGLWFGFPDLPWLDGWARWDAGWYGDIAQGGYWLRPGQQSPVAYFPGYPLLMRAGALLTRNVLLAGILISLAAGAVAAILFHRWTSVRLGPMTARFAVTALLVYPFAYYLYGAVYPDALFLLLAVASFVLLERDKPWMAGLVGAAAAATRPYGFILAVGLVARLLEKRDAIDFRPFRLRLNVLRGRDFGVLAAPLGLIAYCAYLWYRFGDPFAFVTVSRASGWEVAPGVRTWLKYDFFRLYTELRLDLPHVIFALHAALTIGALLLVILVWRRFGWGYGIYTLAVIALPAISSKDFVGMGRYLLAAFPVFAIVGEILAERPRMGLSILVISTAAMGTLASLYARWFYVS